MGVLFLFVKLTADIMSLQRLALGLLCCFAVLGMRCLLGKCSATGPMQPGGIPLRSCFKGYPKVPELLPALLSQDVCHFPALPLPLLCVGVCRR